MTIKNWHILVAFLVMLIVPISAFLFQTGKEIDAELLNGMLTGSSILLAFLFTLLARALQEKRVTEWLKVLLWELLIGFGVLLAGAIFMFYSALGVMPRIFALSTLMYSFEVNFLFTVLYCLNVARTE